MNLTTCNVCGSQHSASLSECSRCRYIREFPWTTRHEQHPEYPNGWIQWKGTGVCMDVHLPCCDDAHVDADFCYFIKCSCGKVWNLDPTIKLVELHPDEVPLVGNDSIVHQIEYDN